MKRKITRIVLSSGLILLMMSVSFAQGRGNGHGKHGHGNKHDRDWSDNVRIREYHYEGDLYVRRGNHYDHHYHVNPWMKRHHPHMKTRYVYFRDYNVYYDYHRNIYMTLSGRNWVFSAEIPLVMRHVEPHRIVYVDVDYLRDDLYYYYASPRHYETTAYCTR